MPSGATVLSIVQEFCTRQSLAKPTAAINSTDETVQNIMGILREACEDLANNDWQVLHWIQHFQHQNLPGYMAFPFPWDQADTSGGAYANTNDYPLIVDQTLWDVTNRRPVYGPMSPQDWNTMLTMRQSQAVYNYRILGGGSQSVVTSTGAVVPGPVNTSGIAIYPVPSDPTAVTFSVEFVSDWYARDFRTGYPIPTFLNDADSTVFPTTYVLAGLRWRWKKEKGLVYAEDQKLYNEMILGAQGQDGGAPRINMGKPREQKIARPGLLVAAGNWNL
jgi:hypothetical protein